MHRLASLSSLALVAVAALAAPASADVTLGFAATPPPPPPPPAPTVRDHRDPQPVAVVSERPRYRRRPGPGFMLPLRLDIGATGANTSRGFLPGLELRLGVHWASLSPEPTNFDVGLGVFGAALKGPDGVGDPDHRDVAYGGAYLEVGETLSHGDYWRTWASGRGEYLGTDAFGKTSSGFGVAGRLSAELYTSGVGIAPRGLFLGTYAVGVYVEAAARGLGDDVGEVQVSGGLTIRTPFVLEL